MKRLIIYFSLSIALNITFSYKKTKDPTATIITTDGFAVVVDNGYSEGINETGDTVYIFTSHYLDNQILDKWNGDISMLNAQEEWHT